MKPSEQAMVPDFFRNVIEEAQKDIKKPKEGDDDLLLALADSQSWQLLKSIIEGIEESINESAKRIAGSAKTWEEVGKIYFARDVSIDSIRSIINIVELRKEARHAQESLGTEEK